MTEHVSSYDIEIDTFDFLITVLGGPAAISCLVIALFCDLTWPHLRQRKHMMMVQTMTAFFWGGHFYFMDAATAVGVNVIFASQAFLSIWYHRPLNKAAIFGLSLAALPILAMTWDGWHSILPVIALFGVTASRLMKSEIAVTATCLFLCSIPFAIYGLVIESYLLIACDAVLLPSTMIGLARKLLAKRKERRISGDGDISAVSPV